MLSHVYVHFRSLDAVNYGWVSSSSFDSAVIARVQLQGNTTAQFAYLILDQFRTVYREDILRKEFSVEHYFPLPEQ